MKNNSIATEQKFETKRVIGILEKLMVDVTEKETNSETVHAACACADRITDIMKMHLDVERLRMKQSLRNTIDV